MATYQEIFGLYRDSTIRNRVSVAVIIKADAIRQGATPSAEEIAWAKTAFISPIRVADEVLMAVLAANKDNSVAQITGASDAQLPYRNGVHGA